MNEFEQQLYGAFQRYEARDETMTNEIEIDIDWIETKTTQLLAAAKRSGFFNDVINDAKEWKAEGYAWDVALAKSSEYWCS